MPRRPDNLETLRLSIEILNRIPRGWQITAPELRNQLKEAGIERNLRTIQRQLGMLSAHFDIDCNSTSRPYGYRWKPSARGLSVPMMGAAEALLLRLAERHLRNLFPASLMRSMDPFFQQADRLFDPYGMTPQDRNHRQWLEKVGIVSDGQPLLPPKIDSQIFETVSEALFNNLRLAIEYRNQKGLVHKANVMPLGLVQQGLRLYLVVRFEGYDNERNLALHRFIAARLTTLSFERPKGFDLARYAEEERFSFGQGHRIRLHFSIDRWAGQHLKETPLSEDQVIVEHGDFFRVSATVVESARLDTWLSGFGDDVWQILRRSPPNRESLR